jgi:hypothetical protein
MRTWLEVYGYRIGQTEINHVTDNGVAVFMNKYI